MFESYMTLWHLKALLCWILANCLLPWYSIWRNKRLRPDQSRDIERFKPFICTNYDKFSYLGCIWTHFFFLPRYCFCLLILFNAVIVTKIITLGYDLQDLNETRKKLIICLATTSMRVFGPVFGCWKFETHRPKVDYSKWLGPEWKPTYDGATMYVSNH